MFGPVFLYNYPFLFCDANVLNIKKYYILKNFSPCDTSLKQPPDKWIDTYYVFSLALQPTIENYDGFRTAQNILNPSTNANCEEMKNSIV